MRLFSGIVFILFGICLIESGTGTESDNSEGGLESENVPGSVQDKSDDLEDVLYDEYEDAESRQNSILDEASPKNATEDSDAFPKEVFLSLRNITADAATAFRSFTNRNDVVDLQASASDNLNVTGNDTFGDAESAGINLRALRDAAHVPQVLEEPLPPLHLPYKHTKIDTADLSDCALQGEWKPIGVAHGHLHVEDPHQMEVLQSVGSYSVPSKVVPHWQQSLGGGGQDLAHNHKPSGLYSGGAGGSGYGSGYGYVETGLGQFQKIKSASMLAPPPVPPIIFGKKPGYWKLPKTKHKFFPGKGRRPGGGHGYSSHASHLSYGHSPGHAVHSGHGTGLGMSGSSGLGHGTRGSYGYGGGALVSGSLSHGYGGFGGGGSTSGGSSHGFGGGASLSGGSGHGFGGGGSGHGYGGGSSASGASSHGFGGGGSISGGSGHGYGGGSSASGASSHGFGGGGSISGGSGHGYGGGSSVSGSSGHGFGGGGGSSISGGSGHGFGGGSSISGGHGYGGGSSGGSGYGAGGLSISGNSGALDGSLSLSAGSSSLGHSVGGGAVAAHLIGGSGSSLQEVQELHSGGSGSSGYIVHGGGAGVAGENLASSALGPGVGEGQTAILVQSSGSGGQLVALNHGGMENLLQQGYLPADFSSSGEGGHYADSTFSSTQISHGIRGANSLPDASFLSSHLNQDFVVHGQGISDDLSSSSTFTCGKNHDHNTNYHTATFQVADHDHPSSVDVLQYGGDAAVLIKSGNAPFHDEILPERKHYKATLLSDSQVSGSENELASQTAKLTGNPPEQDLRPTETEATKLDDGDEPERHSYYHEITKVTKIPATSVGTVEYTFSKYETKPQTFSTESDGEEQEVEQPQIIRELEHLSNKFQLDLENPQKLFEDPPSQELAYHYPFQEGEQEGGKPEGAKEEVHEGITEFPYQFYQENPQHPPTYKPPSVKYFPRPGKPHFQKVSYPHPKLVLRKHKPKHFLQKKKNYEVQEHGGERHRPVGEIFPPQKFPKQFHNPKPNFAVDRPKNGWRQDGYHEYRYDLGRKVKKIKTKGKLVAPILIRRPVNPVPVIRVVEVAG